MPSSLLEVIKMDLDAYPLRKKEELKGYTRWLLGEAYIGKDGDTNTHKYAKQNGPSHVSDEIRSMVFRGDMILNYERLLDKVSDVVVSNYMESVKQKNQGSEIGSFNEVMQKTLSYYQEEYNYQDKSEVVKFAKIILSDYFDNKHVYVFSSKNGTRSYVTKRSPEQILDEMSKELNMISKVPGAIISVYANKIANDFILKKNSAEKYEENGINSITDMIVGAINRASLNDKQKAYLINEFQNGNVDALERYIPQNLIDEYKKVSTSLNDDNYSK